MKRFLLAVLVLGLAACDPAETSKTEPVDGAPVVPATYSFDSRFVNGANSVSYSGQVMRHVLLADLSKHLANLTARIDGDSFNPVTGEVVGELNFFYAFDSATSGDQNILLTTEPATKQAKYNDLSKDKDLKGKIAPELRGWTGVATPDELVQSWFATVETQAIERAAGTIPLGADGIAIEDPFITAQGLDLRELSAKFLIGAVSYYRAAHDYLSDAEAGKGLLSDNEAPAEGEPYTPLEHAWDEAFGYFGASRDYGVRTVKEIAEGAAFDSNGDGAIDLKSEYTFSNASYAARRDNGAKAATTFAADAWKAFITGRALIVAANGALTPEQLTELKGYRDAALAAWEKALAASAVHYINETLVDMGLVGTVDYKFSDHAAHWSELKGFALSLQYSQFKKITDAQYDELHALIGQAPVLPGAAGEAAYKTALNDAKALLQTVYGFDAANMGDTNGANGW